MSEKYEFKPWAYPWRTLLVFMLFSGIAIFLYRLTLALFPSLFNNLVFQIILIGMLCISVLAVGSASYCGVICRVLPEGLDLPLSSTTASAGSTVSSGSLFDVVFIVIFALFEWITSFNPSFEKVTWDQVDNVSPCGFLIWRYLKIRTLPENPSKSSPIYLIPWPVYNKKRFKDAVLEYAPEGNPLHQWVIEAL